MNLSSPVFQDGAPIPQKYTCKGENINPPLEISSIPKKSHSFALIVEDVNATPKPWTHWFVFNIPLSIQIIKEGMIPVGAVEGLANGGTHGYEGPCPKYFLGNHHYRFRLLALSQIINLPATITKDDFLIHSQDLIIAEASLIGTATGTGEALLLGGKQIKVIPRKKIL